VIDIRQGDCRDVLATLPAESVQCCVTSPPYYGLRDYGTGTWSGGDAACEHLRAATKVSPSSTLRLDGREHLGPYVGEKATRVGLPFTDICGKCGATRTDSQIGLEQTPDAYVAELVAVFREVRRVLRPDGVLFLNLGDSYASGMKGGGGGGASSGLMRDGRDEAGRASKFAAVARQHYEPRRFDIGEAKPKDLLMIPARVALALQADGWWLRSDIIWHKPNPMPESVSDRPTSAHEHVFLLAKSARYYWDAEAVAEVAIGASGGAPLKARDLSRGPVANGNSGLSSGWSGSSSRNCRSVWTIASHSFPDAHFATFPPELAERCIRAGSSERGCCASCKAPRVRVVERGKPDLAHQRASGGDPRGEYHGTSTKDHAAHGVQDASAVKARILAGMVHKETTGWAASCACDAAVVPCTVLDPFAGAFTTPLAADRLRRHAIGIELNADYCAMARRRLVDDAGMFLEFA
jgi:DNA modification methylase